MTKAEVRITHTEKKQFFSGDFAEDATPIRYGSGGLRSPIEWTLTVTETITVKDANKRYRLQLDARNKHPLGRLHGYFGYPTPAKHEQTEQGYDAAGLIRDVPRDILEAVEEVTQVPLTTLV